MLPDSCTALQLHRCASTRHNTGCQHSSGQRDAQAGDARLFAARRSLPQQQNELLSRHANSGRPLVGLSGRARRCWGAHSVRRRAGEAPEMSQRQPGLLRLVDAHPKAGVVGCRVYYETTPVREPARGLRVGVPAVVAVPGARALESTGGARRGARSRKMKLAMGWKAREQPEGASRGEEFPIAVNHVETNSYPGSGTPRRA